jgi:hypothetical protein
MPPRVPNGAPSTCRIWFTTFGTLYMVCDGVACVSPIASRLIFPAARTYPCITAGVTVNASAMLSNPWLMSSGGSREETSTSRSSRSRTELRYSVRLRRCRSGAPANGWSAAARSIPRFDHFGKRGELRRIGPRSACRRHHPGSQFARHFFRRFRIPFRMRQVQLGPGKSTRLEFVVMTSRAIAVDHWLQRRGRLPESRAQRHERGAAENRNTVHSTLRRFGLSAAGHATITNLVFPRFIVNRPAPT